MATTATFDWATCEDPEKMLQAIGQGGSKRKLRLFAVYMARRMLSKMGPNPPLTENSDIAVDMAERAALNRVKSGDLEEWNFLANNPSLLFSGASWTDAMRWVESITVRVEPFEDAPTDAELQYAADLLRELFPDPFAWKAKRCPHCQGDVTKKATRSGLMAKCSGVCLKEIDLWSNWQAYPFRHAWRTPAVVGIAQRIEAITSEQCDGCNGTGTRNAFTDRERDCNNCGGTGRITVLGEPEFDLMPILADALMDADCADERILNHCRQTRRRVRCKAGCELTPCDDHYRVYEHAGPDSRWSLCESCDGAGFVYEPVQHLRGCWVIDLILNRD